MNNVFYQMSTSPVSKIVFCVNYESVSKTAVNKNWLEINKFIIQEEEAFKVFYSVIVICKGPIKKAA